MAEQYLSQNRKVGDGVTTIWTFSFEGARPDANNGTAPYLKTEDVRAALVEFDAVGAETRTPLVATLIGPDQLEITPAVPVDQDFVIYRDTLSEYPVSDFVDFSSISERDLDDAFRQAVFIVQETLDNNQDVGIVAANAADAANTATAATATFQEQLDELETSVDALLAGGAATDLMFNADNLANLENKATARLNLGVLSVQEVEQETQDRADAAVLAHSQLADPHTVYLRKADNLAQLTSASTARTNLGLGTAATQPDTRYAHRGNNLGDLADKAAARANLSVVERTSQVGAAVLPSGSSADRPAVPQQGNFRFNTETTEFEGYNGSGWGGVGAIPLGTVQFFSARSVIAAGYIAYDGQELSRATYQNLYDFAVAAGLVETEANWQADPAKRGRFSDGDGSTTFRVPDYNGKSAGSLGSVFLGGDGLNSAGVSGDIQASRLGEHTHYSFYPEPAEGGADAAANLTNSNSPAARAQSGWAGSGLAYRIGSPSSNADAPSVGLTSSTGGIDTRPTNVTGVWCGRAFGAVVNAGSADAAQLASDYANLAGRVSALEAEPSIGWNQTWQDVAASRSTGVTYTNSTGAPIQLAISLSPSGANRDILIDGQMIARTDSSSNIGNHYMVVQDGSSYEVSGGAISKWWELR